MERQKSFNYERKEKPSSDEIKARNLELFGAKIKQYRLREKLSAEELAEKLGIGKSAVRNWECGLTRPDPELLYKLFEVLNVEPNAFFGIGGFGNLLTKKEKEIINNYRLLDNAGKEDFLAYSNMIANQAHMRALRESIKHPLYQVTTHYRGAAAGTFGVEWEDYPSEEEIYLFDSPLVRKADEIFVVCGSSMEPQFHDKDWVLVQYCTSIQSGDIGIFLNGREAFIKEARPKVMHSLNPEYDDVKPDDDGARIVGRVLGRVTEEMIPTEAEINLYEEALETIVDE